MSVFGPTIVNAIKVSLVARLAGDSTLTGMLAAGTAGIYDAPAPESATDPYIVYQKITDTTAYTMGGRAWDDQVFLVKGVTRGASKRAGGSISERIDALLGDAALTITGGTVLQCRRVTGVEYPEADRGDTYHHIGAQYRIWTS